MGLVLRSVVFPVLAVAIAVTSVPAPARSQDIFAGFVVARVCLPYASRAKSFESAIRAARDMGFRRPDGDNAPLDDWASEIEMVHRDGRWRLRIEESTVTEGDADVYSVRCGLWSNNASARELGQVARLMVGNHVQWSRNETDPWRWDRRMSRPEQSALRIDVTEEAGRRPVLAARGFYY